MRKTLITGIVLISLFSFAACGNDDGGMGNNNATPKNTYNPLKTPAKIEGLYVGTCKELFTEMRSNNKQAADDELYRAASVILANEQRIDESNACCDNIKDENLRADCKISG